MPITNDYIRNVTGWGFSRCRVFYYRLVVMRSRLIRFGSIKDYSDKFVCRLLMATFVMLQNGVLGNVGFSIIG
jgi:hypothetical protein